MSKWSGLLPFAVEYWEKKPEATITEIAREATEHFGLTEHPETVRKALSKLLKTASTQSVRLEVPQESENFIHHQSPGRYLVLGCWHVPFHNKILTDGVLSLMARTKFDGLILLGDFLDCNSLSSHDRGRFPAIPGLSLKEEYKQGEQVINQLLQSLPPNAAKFYLYGNHEDSYFRFIADMQNAKTPPQSPTEGLKLFEKGFRVIESYSTGSLKLGAHIELLHGVYYNTHCAKAHIDKLRTSTLFAHTHRIQSFIEGHTGGFNIGWGGDSTAPAFGYADRGMKASWQNGFAEVLIDENGDYFVNQIIANSNKFYYNGRQYYGCN
jgi:predicted phosphodiesterase